ncbi:glycogen synthase [Pseudarthrobacter sp. So.54]
MPARDLWRRRGPRGRTQPGARPARGFAGPRFRRAPRARVPRCDGDVLCRTGGPRRGERRAADPGGGPADRSGHRGADVVHSHTWYANMVSHIASLLHGIPHVLSAHSLEPLRPWKAEQLGGGYALSSWVEKTAYEAAAAIIAVSEGMRQDILRSYPDVDPAKVKVVHNGIDVSLWNRDENDDVVRALGIDPERPSVVFVGRNTRQKGVPYLLRAAAKLPADVQLVLCLGAADTPELAAETARLIGELQTQRSGVIVVERMLPRHELIQVLSHATAFACPSIYEPLGIVNLEAMACGAAVVASATGGIPEVVQHGATGLLVDIEQVTDGTGTPLDPEKFVTEFAAALTEVVSDPARARAMGQAKPPPC